MFATTLAPRVFDEDALHRLGGGDEEMLAIGEGPRIVWSDQMQVGIMNQSGGVECLAGLFVSEFLPRS